MRKIAGIIAISLFCAGCAGTSPPTSRGIVYPYVASVERQGQIKIGMAKIREGMSPSEVEAILGKTDIVMDLFGRGMGNPNPIGYTWWYILERKTDKGSSAERGEKLVRISFDLKDKVTKVDFWGFDKPSGDKPSEATSP
jgi:hypothetical protein